LTGEERDVAGEGEKTFEVEPLSSLFDEDVFIIAAGLERGERVVMTASMKDDNGLAWTSRAEYVASGFGVVEPHRQPPDSGSYTGVEPMGLFWSMTPDDGSGTPFLKTSSDPVTVDITASAGGSKFASVSIERLFISEGVEKVEPGDGLHGTLFTPASGTPSPGVIVLHGTDAHTREEMASLLASRGFAALALRYIGEEGLPDEMIEVPVEYVGKAVDWLSARPEVAGRPVGLLGTSRGGELALLAASHLSKIKAVVSFSGGGVAFEGLHADPRVKDVKSAWSFEGRPVPYLKRVDSASFTARAIWAGIRGKAFSTLSTYVKALEDKAALDEATIRVEDCDAAVLMFAGDHDMVWPSAELSKTATDRLESHGSAKPHELVVFKGAGHGQGIPNRPTTVRETKAFSGSKLAFGGGAAANAHASTEAWKRTISFFKENLG
jgi:dienelactone hydrolase